MRIGERVKSLRVVIWMMIVCGALGMFTRESVAQEREVYVPDALKPWVPWVMAKHGELQCSSVEGSRVCHWPGQMTLEVDDRRGVFTLEAFVQRDGTRVALPGGARHWPQDVRVNGAAAMVFEAQKDVPLIELGRGRSVITGRFDWKSAPEVLQLPADVAVVSLTLDGKHVAWPRHDETGKLWVKEASAASVGEADTIRASVYRHIVDDIPIKVITALELNVAGRAREVSLGKPLIDGGVPVAITGALPTQISADGEVKVYVRPGTYVIDITSYYDSPLEKIVVPERSKEFFDATEYWVWTPDEALRSVELGGLLTIDPSRTTLPERWRGKTTLSARAGDTLELKMTRRGQPDQPPNQVRLNRTLWLDIDGEGYTIKDRLTGQFHQGWRLNYGAEHGELGRVMDRANNEALLITTDLGARTLRGVELRNARLDVEAEVRLEDARSELPAVGWEHDVQQLDATLMMPPGWGVLAAQGVDEMSGTWVDSWDLFEFFVVLMIAFVMGKLFGWQWGVVSALALVLSHGQEGAPRYVWFHIMAVLALLRVLPNKLWLRIPAYTYLGLSFVMLISTFGYYAHQQIRGGLNPQVMTSSTTFFDGDFGGMHEERFIEFEQDEHAQGEGNAPGLTLEDGIVMNSRESSMSSRDVSSTISPLNGKGDAKKGGKHNYRWQQIQQQIDPKEVVQTGPGLPNWSWQSWRMTWNGPVASDHRIKLWLISPRFNLVARILGVLCFLLMGLVVLAPGIFAPRKKVNVDVYKTLKKIIAPCLIGGLALGATLLTAPTTVQAEQQPELSQSIDMLPVSPTALGELERRLLESERCLGECISAPFMSLRLDAEGRYEIRAELHAQRQAGWMLPGPATLVGIDSVQIDGVQTLELRRHAMGMVYVRVPEGRHELVMMGRVNAQSVLTIQLDQRARPHHVKTLLTGWGVDGIDEFGRPDNSLQLSRQADESSPSMSTGDEAAPELPPWYDVKRTLLLGLPWQSRTVISRQDSSRPQLVKIPLLEGEAVISEGIRVEQGEALINFERGVSVVEYMSEIVLPMDGNTTTIALNAPQGKPWSETWEVECSRIWRCDFDGVVPMHTVTNKVFFPIWKPWPGETLEITVQKPRGAKGEAATITQVHYRVAPGKRRLKATLSLTMRASQGGWQRVKLPEGAELQEVKINNAVRNIRPEEDRSVSLPIIPGEQTFVLEWIQPWERELFESFPPVEIGGKAVNATMTMELGSNRWLLWTVGPSWGPAVLFWSHVVLLVVLALLLGRLEQLPLRTYQWLLLVLGMSQLPLLAVLPVVAWFAMLVWRKERPFENASFFVLFQLFLMFWSVITLAVLYAAVHSNLLMDVDMQISGRGSSNTMLNWYIDRTDEGLLPEAGVLSAPLFVWRVVMFAWVLWLVSSLIKWLPWAWQCFSDGKLWMPLTNKKAGTKTPEGSSTPEDTDGSLDAPSEHGDESRSADAAEVSQESDSSGDDEPDQG